MEPEARDQAELDGLRRARIRAKIRTIPDFPKPGILFRDITTLWNDAEGFALCTDAFAERFAGSPFDLVIGIESRGFIIGAALADRLGKGFVPIRKQGKLPSEVERYEYQLEYGSDCVEIHKDAVLRGQKVLLVDDLLATGGTMLAALELLRRVGAEVEACAFIVELFDLGGRGRIEGAGQSVFSLVQFPGG
jgi:adenine phosphoribosyltransferase